MTIVLEARGLAFAYGAHSVLADVDVLLHGGELVGLVGPNGAGKTTLLHLLLGLLPLEHGMVRITGDDARSLSRGDVARRAALVAQDSPSNFALTVREVVSMGRTPHLGRFRPEGAADVAAVDRALGATGIEPLSERLVNELSGGERQRVHIARALAQDTKILLLDEPTANLDVAHQLSILDLVRRLAEQGQAAMAALHDLSLAARYCDRILMLAEQRIVAAGRPEEVITEEHLGRYFGIRARIERDASGHLFVLPLGPR